MSQKDVMGSEDHYGIGVVTRYRGALQYPFWGYRIFVLSNNSAASAAQANLTIGKHTAPHPCTKYQGRERRIPLLSPIKKSQQLQAACHLVETSFLIPSGEELVKLVDPIHPFPPRPLL